MTNKQYIVPEVRFPEFEAQWVQCKLEELANIYDGTHQTPKYVEQGIPFVSVENINDIENTNKYITKEAFEKNYKVKPKIDDIFMTRITAGIIGATALVKNNNPLGYYVSLALIRKKNSDLDVHYLNHRMSSPYFKRELHKRIIHIAFPKKINLGEIGLCKITFPTLDEQTKIAKFLSVTDKRIVLLRSKKEELVKYRKGVMQKIFSQAIRFKDASSNHFPEWEEKELGEVTSYVDYRGRAPKKSDEGIFLVTAKNIKKGFIDYDISKEYVLEKDYNEVMSKGLPQVGDILFTTEAPLGNVCQVDNSNIALAQRVIKLRGKENLTNNFLLHYMLSDSYQKLINRMAFGTTVLGISGKELRKTVIKLPSLAEQTKIADFLTSLDKSIENISQQIDDSHAFKQSLLQKMFI